MTIDLNVLGALMKNIIAYYLDITVVITIECSRSGMKNIQAFQ